MCSMGRKLIISQMKWSKLRGFNSVILCLLKTTNSTSKALFTMSEGGGGGGVKVKGRGCKYLWNRGSRTVDVDVLIHKLFSKLEEPHTTQTLSHPRTNLLVYLLVCIPTRKLPQIKQLLPPSRTTPKKNPAVPCTRDWDLGSSQETNEVKRSARTKKHNKKTLLKTIQY